MLVMESVVVEEGSSQLLEDLVNNLPIGGAEVGAKWLTAREEELVHDDVGEGTHNIRVKLDLTEGRPDIVCMQDNVDRRGVGAEGVNPS